MLSPLWLRTPQQLAAEAQPPGLTTLTAPVERRVLRDLLIVRGEVTAGRSFDVTPGSRVEGQAVVTAIKVQRGDLVRAGSVVLEVSGRPLIVLAGTVPAYRDIKPGASGEDVRQLQSALLELGYNPVERAGVFGAGTKRALTALYNSLGYAPLPANEGDEVRLGALRRQLTMTQRAVADAEEALDAVDADPNATAESRSAAQKALDRAKEDMAAAQDELNRAERASGPMLPISEYVFLPAFPARVDGLGAILGNAVTSPLITLSVGRPVVTVTLTSAQRTLCKLGALAEIIGDGGLSGTGTVTEIGDAPETQTGGPGGASSASDGYRAVITPSPPLDPRFVDQSVRLKIQVAVSDGEHLVVPIAALYAAGDGRLYVNRLALHGGVESIEVDAGLSAEGYVEISPKGAGLAVGDQVVIGGSAP